MGEVTTSEPALGAALLRVIARINRWATRQANLEIPPAQGRLLAQIDELGSARIGDLARADHCSQPTMTTQVQRLEERGWVTRVPDPDDRRAVQISLTDAGEALLTAVREERAAVLAPYIDGLDEAQRARLADAVATLTQILEAAGRAPREDLSAHPREDQENN
jgi:DNA-binding MarR family transcriptional regulator